MKLDDRDIICQQDYTPLSNTELVAHIEEYARLMHSTPLSGAEWLDDIIGPARALLARAEAAEALAYERLESALFAEQRASDAEIERDSANVEAALEQSNAREAWIRVAELEAQLAGHGWRPVTEEPDDMYWYLTLNTNPDEIDDPGYRISFWDGTWEHECTHYRPLPPVPQEPTP